MAENDEIAIYEVSEDGLTWRPYEPARDQHMSLHKRIIFAPAREVDPAGSHRDRAQH